MSLPNRIDFCARELEEHASLCRLRVTRLSELPRHVPDSQPGFQLVEPMFQRSTACL